MCLGACLAGQMDKSLVSKATSADEVPTPGYMFNEIARITHASVKDCQQLEEFLLKRLKKDSVHVKLKALRVIKHCCQQGHASFRREMQRHTAEIKECLGYRGAADPLHGDALNKAVRDLAQEAMAAIFDPSPASEQLHSAGRMQGFGSDGVNSAHNTSGFCPGSYSGSYSSPGLASVHDGFGGFAPPKIESGAYSSGKMQGFGNPSFQQKPTEANRVSAMATAVTSGLKEGISRIQQRAKAADEGYASHGACAPTHQSGADGRSFGGGLCGGASSFQPPAAPAGGASHAQGSNSSYQPGRPGGGWAAPAEPPRSSVPQPAARAPPAAPKAHAAQAGDFERRLVDDITAPGGVRASVPREDLHKFCSACKSLDSAAIAALLQAKLEGGEWQRRLKTLAVIEGLIKDSNAVVLSFFQEQPQLVQTQLNSTQSSLKEKARKVVELLGLGGDAAVTTPRSAPRAVPREAPATPTEAPVENLLDLNEAPPTETIAPSTPSFATPQVGPLASAASASDAPSLFDSLQIATDSVEGAPPPPPGDMFSGMQLADMPPTSAAAPALNGSEKHAPASAPTNASLSLQDAGLSTLELMMASTPAAPPATAHHSMASGTGSHSLASGGGMPNMGIGVPPNMQMQQMALMQHQMAMMQQQIMQQQQLLRCGGKPPSMCGGGYAGHMPSPMHGSMGGSAQAPLQIGAAGASGQTGFDFMSKPSGNDAFDFVGDVISKNKRAI